MIVLSFGISQFGRSESDGSGESSQELWNATRDWQVSIEISALVDMVAWSEAMIEWRKEWNKY